MSGHPNIVAVYDAGVTVEDEPYLVMQLLQNGSLADRLSKSGALPWKEVAAIGIKLAGALTTAHEIGVHHRDVKPANILFSDYGEPMLVDFGTAYVGGAEDTSGDQGVPATVYHCPPEVMAGQPWTERSDVWSLASTLHELLSGSPPFHRPADRDILPFVARLRSDDPPDLRSSGVPDQVCDVLESALAKDPGSRVQSAAEFGRLLQVAEVVRGGPGTPLPIAAQDGEASRFLNGRPHLAECQLQDASKLKEAASADFAFASDRSARSRPLGGAQPRLGRSAAQVPVLPEPMKRNLVEAGSRPRVVMLRGGGFAGIHTLGEGEHIIGRDEHADVVISDRHRLASRNHCVLRVTRNSAEVEDLGSRNGTYVNAVRISAATLLHPGDRLRVGSASFRLDADDATFLANADVTPKGVGGLAWRLWARARIGTAVLAIALCALALGGRLVPLRPSSGFTLGDKVAEEAVKLLDVGTDHLGRIGHDPGVGVVIASYEAAGAPLHGGAETWMTTYQAVALDGAQPGDVVLITDTWGIVVDSESAISVDSMTNTISRIGFRPEALAVLRPWASSMQLGTVSITSPSTAYTDSQPD